MPTSENPNTPLEIGALEAAKRIASEMSDEQLEALVAEQRAARAANEAATKAAEAKDAPAVAAAKKALEDSHTWDDTEQGRRGFN